MIEKLYIRLGSEAQDDIHWLVWADSSKEIIASGVLNGVSELVDLQDKALNRQVVTLVPSCDVVLKSLNIPAKSSKAMRLAAPYMLEDDIAQDVDNLFFAYGKPSVPVGSDNCYMAGVSHQQMQVWLSWLQDANISTKTMIPDALAMPLLDNEWSTVMVGEQVLIRQSVWQARTIDLSLWPLLVQPWQTSQDEAPTLKCYSTIPELENVTHTVELAELPMALLAQHAEEAPINLLQGQYAVKSKQSVATKSWLWVAGFAALALVINFVLKGAQLWQLDNQQVALETQIIETYKSAFPKTKRVRVATIRSQLKRKLAEVGTSKTSDASFLNLLAKVHPALAAVPALKPETLKFDGRRNEIRMQASAGDYQAFDKLKKLLEEQALTVSLGSQNNSGNKVTGSFSITNKKERS